jgi:glycosyltransferase involved in cell wall biosynthesis
MNNIKTPKVSVVIPTYNRGKSILNTLDSLTNQSFSDFEVIIVNDGSTDNTRQILDNASVSYSFSIRIINQANQGRSGSRNTGFNAASSEIIISLDDDMRVSDKFVEAHYRHHSIYPDSILVGVQKEDQRLAKTDIQKFLTFSRLKWLEDLEILKQPFDKNNIYITAANFSIPKKVFNLIGGFDIRLNSYVDYDLAMRATELNVPIYYNTNAFGWHDDFITCRSYINRKRVAHTNWAKLKEMKPELVAKYNKYSDAEVNWLKKLGYNILANKFLVQSIDNFNFFKFILPSKVRFYIYGALVLSYSKYFPKREL